MHQPASANLSDRSSLVFNTQGNSFTGGKQTLAPSSVIYASLNLPNTGAAPNTPTVGDLWLTAADPHLMFVDKNNTTQSLAFVSDVTSGNSNLLGANNKFTGNNTFTASNTFTQPISASITGNAVTVTNGVYANGSYADPSWLTSLSGAKITGAVANAITAGNALNLGGVAASNYARVDTGNSFNGNQTVTGNITLSGSETVSGNVSVSGALAGGSVTIGTGGTPIAEHLSQTPTITVPPIVPKLPSNELGKIA